MQLFEKQEEMDEESQLTTLRSCGSYRYVVTYQPPTRIPWILGAILYRSTQQPLAFHRRRLFPLSIPASQPHVYEIMSVSRLDCLYDVFIAGLCDGWKLRLLALVARRSSGDGDGCTFSSLPGPRDNTRDQNEHTICLVLCNRLRPAPSRTAARSGEVP